MDQALFEGFVTATPRHVTSWAPRTLSNTAAISPKPTCASFTTFLIEKYDDI